MIKFTGTGRERRKGAMSGQQKTIHIAVVEDDELFRNQLVSYLQQYEKETGLSIETSVFEDGYDIAENYASRWEIILMDIEMKLMNGMEAAKKIREKDEQVIIIFITNMAQFAIGGYAVGALDYVLKPVHYYAFSKTLEKAIRRIPKIEKDYFTVKAKDGIFRIDLSTLLWIESRGHHITFHMDSGDAESTVYTMKGLEEALQPKGFSRCSSGFLVNLSRIDKVTTGAVFIGGQELPVSRGRKDAFFQDLDRFL